MSAAVFRHISDLVGAPAQGRADTIQRLWSDYGSVSRIQLDAAHGAIPKTLVAKEVRPPVSSGVSHERKLHSYRVEAQFYRSHAAALARGSPPCAVPVPLHIEVDEDASNPAAFGMTILMTDLRENFPVEVGRLEVQHAKAALEWLAKFHAHFWERPDPALWPCGCFWHFDTRQEEWEDIPREWARLKAVAADIDLRLKGIQPDGGEDPRFRTVCHGDFKQANMAFDSDVTTCAMVDFQYCGAGYGVKDVAYMMASSVSSSAVKRETELLEHYFTCLHAALAARGSPCPEYSKDVFLRHYELALLDFVRFMAGWGWWGNTRWAADKARACLKQHFPG